mmetsp:Transcript_31521/g.48363  ORF Transcript_31521/g.48363 Transcript_31521/m.48363 type:complete len:363 (-) Transcript_31521:948-2036(-)
MMMKRRTIQLLFLAIQTQFVLHLALILSPTKYIKTGRHKFTPLRSSSGTQIDTGSTDETCFPEGTLGPPPHLRALRIGDKMKVPQERPIYYGDGAPQVMEFAIERVSSTPDVFVLRDFLQSEECDAIMRVASQLNMSPAETVTDGDTASRKNCDVTWIPSGANGFPLVSSLVAPIAKYFLSDHFKASDGAGVEDLQVLKYEQAGEFVLHHDGQGRSLTVIYYINGVGGTWFPLAHTSENSDDDPCADMDQSKMDESFAHSRKYSSPQNKAEALQLGDNFEPGKNGLLVQGVQGATDLDESNPNVSYIKKGDAVAFYNYMDDGSKRFDWRALHAGLPADEVKWIANHWFRSNSLLEETLSNKI